MRLADGSLALATAGAGLILLREDGRFLGRVDESVGLQTDVILDLFTDREGGLWLGLNSGVTRAEVTPALTVFDAASGLKRTTARDVLRFQGRLLAATTSGVFALRPAEPASGGRLARFERLPGLEGKFWSLCAHETGGLLAGSEAGIYHQAGAAADGDAPPPTLVSNAPTLALRRSRRDPDRVFAGGGDGTLRALRFAGGKWTDEGVVARINDEIRTLVETASGEIWLGTPLHGIYRVRLDGRVFPAPRP